MLKAVLFSGHLESIAAKRFQMTATCRPSFHSFRSKRPIHSRPFKTPEEFSSKSPDPAVINRIVLRGQSFCGPLQGDISSPPPFQTSFKLISSVHPHTVPSQSRYEGQTHVNGRKNLGRVATSNTSCATAFFGTRTKTNECPCRTSHDRRWVSHSGNKCVRINPVHIGACPQEPRGYLSVIISQRNGGICSAFFFRPASGGRRTGGRQIRRAGDATHKS